MSILLHSHRIPNEFGISQMIIDTRFVQVFEYYCDSAVNYHSTKSSQIRTTLETLIKI